MFIIESHSCFTIILVCSSCLISLNNNCSYNDLNIAGSRK
jgi:hypothetical protein